MSVALFSGDWLGAPRPRLLPHAPIERPLPGRRWCRVLATPIAPHRDLGGLDAELSLHERADAWCLRAIDVLKPDAAPGGYLAAVRYVAGHLAIFVRVAGPEDVAFLREKLGPLDAHVDVTYVDRPRRLTMQEQAAWDECGRLGLDAAERASIPWQMLCLQIVVQWIVNVAQSGGWHSGEDLANGGALNGRLDADDAAPILVEMVRLGWLEAHGARMPHWVHVGDVVYAQYRETPLLRHLLGFQPRSADWKRR